LDQAERPITPVRSFPVRNRPVAELAAVLNGLIAAGVLEAGVAAPRADVSAGASQSNPRPPFATPGGETQGGANPSAASGAARQTVAGSGRSTFSLTADPATNSLIAMGEPRLLSQLESLLTTLDVRQPQVMLEAVLISLSETEALDLGVELERLQSIGDTTLKLTSLFGLSAGGPLTGATPAGAGFTGVVLSPGEYGAVLRALQSINKARSLSNPRLLVTNNEQAVFSSVLQQPITQQTRTGTNDQVFSYGGNESAGTTISVRPQIAQGDHLVLTYSIKLSNFVGASSTAGLPPPKQENAVDSIATIPDGHTVVVGGLEISTETEGESRVPLIGSVPVLGELFKKRTDGSGRSRFYVFIRASVLRSESFGDLKHMSALSSQAMGAPDGWPAVEPRVIR
jgi:general secretion pathway protein D